VPAVRRQQPSMRNQADSNRCDPGRPIRFDYRLAGYSWRLHRLHLAIAYKRTRKGLEISPTFGNIW
jgi:hypothetical protein